jgi:ABC-type nitrate/sulfonate/bicarbonate transport system permease component
VSAVTTALVLATLLVAWEVLSRIGVLDELFMSRPSAVVAASGQMAGDPAVRTALLTTLGSVLQAFAIGTGLGITVGVVLGLNRLLRDAFLPIVMILVGVPKSVFLPVIVLFTGMTTRPTIVFGALLAFLYATVNMVGGIDLIEPQHHTLARAYGSNIWKRFRFVILPGASPGVFAAIWHGLRSAFEGVLIGELFASAVGLGYLAITFSNSFNFAKVYAVQIAVAIALIVVGTGWGRLEAWIGRWRKEGLH